MAPEQVPRGKEPAITVILAPGSFDFCKIEMVANVFVRKIDIPNHTYR